MKTSELIKQLQEVQKENGDLEIQIPCKAMEYKRETTDDSFVRIVGISVLVGDDDKPECFRVMDEGWADALL